MIEHELLLLGLLRESPKHGYEIKKQLKEILYLFTGLEVKSVYYPLRVLEKKGLLAKRIVKHGRRPERFIYELTPKGKLRFNELLAKSFLNFKRPQFSLDLSLYFINYIKPSVAKRRLRARRQILKRISAGLAQLAQSLKKKRRSPLIPILKHNLGMVRAEADFLRKMEAGG